MVHSVYNANTATLNPHRLSYFLIILAIGVCVDQRRSHHAWLHDAERFHELSRAALFSTCETSVINEPSIDAINALFYMSRYLTMFLVEKEAVEYAWAVLVHRYSNHLKVIPEELDRRKTLLWCLLNVDHRLGLMLRRPPSISLRYVDVDPPTTSEFPPQGPREVYQQWHYTFAAQCFSPTLEFVVSTTPPPYSEFVGISQARRPNAGFGLTIGYLKVIPMTAITRCGNGEADIDSVSDMSLRLFA
ncbi:hypothetical protein BD311DRAFT_779627 [Dichomitus squalens]|uniref:Transcription factor domain-containing protein n=1 Tax=Dichomitus squalens TaxID=114155 RepID=A0A4Q9MJT5_9APHY|nr:hypothetical protein BD311DRAFT_779627 [Dichomitus squalens]